MSLGVGLIGCGDISGIYLRNAALFADYRIVACASRSPARAQAVAAQHGVAARGVDELLASADVDIVLNLTPPLAHADITRRALAAGKHVYSEKPLGIDAVEAAALAGLAEAAGLRIGVAPDTVLGPAVQTARRLVAEGAIGRPLFGTAAFLGLGPELFHPAPDFFYQRGGGPLLDIGPYYLTALTQILGPMARVSASGFLAAPERRINAPGLPRHGEVLHPVVPTTAQTQLAFAAGAVVSFLASWDAHTHGLPHIEIHGTEGSLRVPNPDWFGGDLLLSAAPGVWTPVPTDALPFGAPNRVDEAGVPVADYRGLGLADMAQAIRRGRPHRASGELALHIGRTIDALAASMQGHAWIEVTGGLALPAPLLGAEATGLLA